MHSKVGFYRKKIFNPLDNSQTKFMITKNLGLFLNILEHYQFSNENLPKIMEGVIE
jgi:hypothetical protein